MIKNLIIVIVVLSVAAISVEVVHLLKLRASVASYATYWQQRAQQPGTFTYVALGDSAAQGIGAQKPDLGYVGLLVQHIERVTGRQVRIVNLSVTGARIQDVIQKQVPELQKYKPDLVTVEIGGNDVTHYDSKTFQSDYQSLAASLPAGTFVSNIPYFGGRIRANDKALEASQVIKQAAQVQHLSLVDLQTITHQQQSFLNYAADFFHPSDRGYRIWESAFWTAIEPAIIPKDDSL